MAVSQKCQYALRAMLYLSKKSSKAPVTIGEIAEAEDIPVRFLELILNELRQAGYAESRRGVQGGYLLPVAPRALTVGEIIRVIDGPTESPRQSPSPADLPFANVWKKASAAVNEIYDSTTFADLIEEEAARGKALNYNI